MVNAEHRRFELEKNEAQESKSQSDSARAKKMAREFTSGLNKPR